MRTRIIYLSAVFLGLLAVAPLPAQNIVDRAKFFSADAVKQAEDTIKQLERKHSVPVRVETFDTVPDAQAEKVKGMSAKDRGAFFANWLKELAQERKAKGVFVLICREPSHLRVGVSKELHKRGFTDADRDAASEKLIARFKEKDYDRGLQDVLTSLRATAERKLAGAGAIAPTPTRRASPAAADPAVPSWSGWLCLGIGGVVAIIAILSVVGAMFRNTSRVPVPGGYGGAPGGYGGYGGGYGGGWGGGGMMGGLLSGLGGALLGNWIYDRWSGGNSAHAGEPHDAGWSGHTTGPADDNYQDFGSSGGDFGDSSGGDFGGGDFGGGGGGDFGGGDSGGGGGGDF